MNVPFIIYADMESLLENNACHNNPKRSSTTKINIQLLDTHYLCIVHLMLQKTTMVII